MCYYLKVHFQGQRVKPYVPITYSNTLFSLRFTSCRDVTVTVLTFQTALYGSELTANLYTAC